MIKFQNSGKVKVRLLLHLLLNSLGLEFNSSSFNCTSYRLRYTITEKYKERDHGVQSENPAVKPFI